MYRHVCKHCAKGEWESEGVIATHLHKTQKLVERLCPVENQRSIEWQWTAIPIQTMGTPLNVDNRNDWF